MVLLLLLVLQLLLVLILPVLVLILVLLPLVLLLYLNDGVTTFLTQRDASLLNHMPLHSKISNIRSHPGSTLNFI